MKSNSEKLRALADWFDAYDNKCCKSNFKNDEVQQDLRAMANEFEQLNKHSVSGCQCEAYAAFCIELDRQGLKPITYKDYLEIG